jgi:hypothetical protein
MTARNSKGQRSHYIAAGFLKVLPDDSQTKIQNLNLPGDHQNIIRLQIAMDNAPAMQVGQSLEHLPQQCYLLWTGLISPGFNQSRGIF